MALKKETQQVRYTEQIGVNRGGGFAAMADASITQANQLNSLVTQFADVGLKELQSFGKKIGEEAAQNYEFGEKKVTYTDTTGELKEQFVPTKVEMPKHLNTVTGKETFEKEIYNRYRDEVFTNIKNIILEERTTAEENYDTQQNFSTIVDARLEPLLSELEPKFKIVAQTFAEEQHGMHGRMVATNFSRHREQILGVQWTNTKKVAVDSINSHLFTNGDNKKSLELIKDLEEKTTIAQDNNVVDAEATGSQFIKDQYIKANTMNLFKGVHIDDLDNASSMDIQNAINNYTKIASLIQISGPNKITLTMANGEKKVINKSDLQSRTQNNFGVLSDIRTAFSNQANMLKSMLTQKTTDTSITSLYAHNKNQTAIGMNASTGSMTKKEYSGHLFKGASFENMINDFNSSVDEIERVDLKTALGNTKFLKWSISTQHVLPEAVINNIEAAYGNFNQNSIEQLRNSGIITYMKDYRHTFKIDENVSNVEMDIFSTLGIDRKTKNRILAVENALALNPNLVDALAEVTNFYNDYDKQSFQSASQAIQFSSGGRVKSVNDLNAYIVKETGKLISSIDGADGVPILSEILVQEVIKQVHLDIIEGMPLRNENDTKPLIKDALQYVMNGETGFGFSKFGYSNFRNIKLDEGEYQDKSHFINSPPEKFSLPDGNGNMNIEWMTPAIDYLVKNSEDYSAIDQFKPEFGKNIFLQATDINNATPKYYVVFVNQNGKATPLIDKNMLPIVYDPIPDYKQNMENLNMNAGYEKMIDDYRNKRMNFLEDRANIPKEYLSQSIPYEMKKIYNSQKYKDNVMQFDNDELIKTIPLGE